MIIVFDTETTGLRPGQIGQISYILDDGLSARGFNRFFAVAYMPPDAQAVHGFSAERLAELSGGARFADAAPAIHADFKAADIAVGHNLDFDMSFLRAELARAGIRYRHRRGLCTMYYFTKLMGLPGRGGTAKPPSLRELCAFLAVDDGAVRAHSLQIFGEAGGAHDARYDAAATHLCVRSAIEKGFLRDLFGKVGEKANE